VDVKDGQWEEQQGSGVKGPGANSAGKEKTDEGQVKDGVK